jgi:diguanylate cyclase (GGDEF)-like protein
MRNYHDELKIRALKDLTNRAKSGIFVYIANWLVLAFTFDLQHRQPFMFALNTTIFAALMLSRLSHYLASRNGGGIGTDALHHWLVATIMLGGVHWGLLSAWFIYTPELNDARLCTIILTPCFALGGACTLSISQEIRNWFPFTVIMPSIVAFLYVGGLENYVIAGLSCFLLLYVASSSKASHNDYWSAITNNLIAEERAELMEKLSTIDPLTHLKNRLFFDNELDQEWKRCQRIGCPLSILMIDLDHFKRINDDHGHLFGDDCLRAVALSLASEGKRPSDCVARYGGEEFIMLLPNTNEHGAQVIAHRVLDAISRIELSDQGQAVRLTCSIGGATTVPSVELRANELLQKADTALYAAKEQGRNRFVADNLNP